MRDDVERLRAEVQRLAERVEAAEQENAAFSALFGALTEVLGPSFLDRAATVVELTEAHAQGGSPVGKRMTEALRIIDQIRAIGHGHPKPGGVV